MIEAGPELDALIAEQWMGAQLIDYAWYDGTLKPFLWWPDDAPPRGDDFQRLPNGWLCEWNSIPRYSTDMGVAWEVVEVMAQDLTPRVNGLPGATAFLYWWEAANLWADDAETAAARICRAALAIRAGQQPLEGDA